MHQQVHLFLSVSKLFDQRAVCNNGCKYDGNHRQQFDEDVDCRTGGILEWVTNGIANNSSFVVIRAFAAQVICFDVFLRIVPSTAGVGHHDCQNETGNGCACQHTGNTNYAHEQTNDNRNNDCQIAGRTISCRADLVQRSTQLL